MQQNDKQDEVAYCQPWEPRSRIDDDRAAFVAVRTIVAVTIGHGKNTKNSQISATVGTDNGNQQPAYRAFAASHSGYKLVRATLLGLLWEQVEAGNNGKQFPLATTMNICPATNADQESSARCY